MSASRVDLGSEPVEEDLLLVVGTVAVSAVASRVVQVALSRQTATTVAGQITTLVTARLKL